MANLVETFDRVEPRLRKFLVGKTLLGEVTFSEAQLESVSSAIRRLVESRGPSHALRFLREEAPAVLGLWLSNEAFFNFQSGAYWPYVLKRVGIDDVNQHSSRFGAAFLEVLKKLDLPSFRRMKTSWSYLGPILAHAGIPKSCLPEYFEKVLPQAVQLDIRGPDEFDELIDTLPQFYLTRATERFLTFGENIALDFVSRTIDLDRLYRTTSEIASPSEVRLPGRVVDAYRNWVESPGRHREVRTARRPFKRPQLRVDPSQGVVLGLPAQALRSGERRAEWLVELDVGEKREPESVDVCPDPGERVSSEQEFIVANPFRYLRIRFIVDGAEFGTWSFEGLSPERPVLFFSPESDVVVPSRSLESRDLGVVAPPEWTIMGRCGGDDVGARVTENRGRMPLGWGRLSVRVVDLGNAEEVVCADPSPGGRMYSVKLGEASPRRPRLLAGEAKQLPAPDVEGVFLGSAPVIEIYTCQSTLKDAHDWRLTVRSHLDVRDARASVAGRVSDLNKMPGDGAWVRIPLGQPGLLGSCPWGEFEVEVAGPIGQDARFRFRVLPLIEIASDLHDWSGQEDAVRARLRVPEGVTVHGAEETSDPREYILSTTRRSRRVEIETVGFGGATVTLPLDVRLPQPSWSVYDPIQRRALLVWSRQPLRLSLTETEGTAPTLQLRLNTLWGIPRETVLELRSVEGCVFEQPVELDGNGLGSVDLAPLLAFSRQRKSARLQAVLRLRLGRIVELQCLEICREWAPRNFAYEERESGELAFQWQEQIAVDDRALRVESLLTPWENVRWIDIPDKLRAELKLPAEQISTEPGFYKVTLGRRDEWTGGFEPAQDAEAEISIGDASDWTRAPLFADTGPNGYLYRLLLENYARVGGNLEAPTAREMSGDPTFASHLLRTRHALTQNRTDSLLRRVDALLSQLQLQSILTAIADQPDESPPEVLLRSGLLSRTWRSSEGGPESLTTRHMETLWRIWKPLGIWTELHTYSADVIGAEARVIRYLGAEPLSALSPLQVGSKIRWWDSGEEGGVAARVEEIDNDTGRSPFELARLGGGVEVDCRGESPEVADLEFRIHRGLSGEWLLEAFEPGSTEMLRSMVTKLERWGVFYPRPPRDLCSPPDGPMIALIHSGNREAIEAIRRQIEDVVPIAIGGSAFQSACFEWSAKAAADPNYRSRLLELATEVAAPVGSSFECDPPSFRDSASWRIFSEAKSRWIRNSLGEPLFAIPLLSWLVAVDVIWPSLGKTGWLRISDTARTDLAVELHTLVPRLFEHDLLKICVIEMLNRARWLRP